MLWPVHKPIPGLSEGEGEGEGGGGAGDQGAPLDRGQASDGSPIGGELHLPRRAKFRPEEIAVRWRISLDNAALLRIERNSSHTPWTEEDFLKRFSKRNIISLVVVRNNSILGFIVYQLHSNSFSIENLAVDPSVRRMGVGTAMINFLIDKLSSTRRSEISLTVRESNLDAQLFLRKCGFKAVSVQRKFFDDTDDDGYFMAYKLSQRRRGV